MTRIAESRDGYDEMGRAMRVPRRSAALRAEPLRVSSLRAAAAIASVALCIFCIGYFGGQLLRGWLS